MDRVYSIRTPEMVRFDFRLAGPVSRFFAWGIDMGVIFAAVAALAALSCLAGVVLAALSISAQLSRELLLALGTVGIFALYYGYFAFFEWRWSGRTFGKRAIGLRVIQDDGTRIAAFQAIARNLLRFVDSAFPFYTIGLGAVLASERLQRLGDLCAGTVVIREDRDAELPKAALLKGEAQVKGLDPRLLKRLRKDERELLVDAARRADEIDLSVRGPLFQRLARHFSGRLEIERDPHVSDEKLVQNLARALLAHERERAGGGAL